MLTILEIRVSRLLQSDLPRVYFPTKLIFLSFSLAIWHLLTLKNTYSWDKRSQIIVLHLSLFSTNMSGSQCSRAATLLGLNFPQTNFRENMHLLNDPRFSMHRTSCKHGDVKYPKRCNVNPK